MTQYMSNADIVRFDAENNQHRMSSSFALTRFYGFKKNGYIEYRIGNSIFLFTKTTNATAHFHTFNAAPVYKYAENFKDFTTTMALSPIHRLTTIINDDKIAVLLKRYFKDKYELNRNLVYIYL